MWERMQSICIVYYVGERCLNQGLTGLYTFYSVCCSDKNLHFHRKQLDLPLSPYQASDNQQSTTQKVHYNTAKQQRCSSTLMKKIIWRQHL